MSIDPDDYYPGDYDPPELDDWLMARDTPCEYCHTVRFGHTSTCPNATPPTPDSEPEPPPLLGGQLPPGLSLRPEVWDYLALLESSTQMLVTTAEDIDPAVMPDVAGRIRAVEVRLAELRRRLNVIQVEAARDPESPVGPATFPAEPGRFGTVKPRVVGTQFRTVTTRSAKRTYNVAAIIAGTMDALHTDLSATVRRLMSDRVIRIEPRWSELERFAKKHGLPMKVVDHAISEDDPTGAWVGEVWTEPVKQEAINDDGRPV